MTSVNDTAPTALITGASGGIGYELARLFANDHHNLVLVARSEVKLAQFADELQRQFGVLVKAIALDLTAPNAPQILFDQLKREGTAVDILINNAGYGKLGEFAAVPIDYFSHQAVSRADAGARLRQDHESCFYRRVPARTADGRLLRHQGLRDFVLRGAGQ